MFKDKLGDTMEVYIDDMVMKSMIFGDHLRDLKEAFDIPDEYNMTLNPLKSFWNEVKKVPWIHGNQKKDRSKPKTNKSNHGTKILVFNKGH